jgi:Chromo (CHRromatin Organisation MOdifier) domain
MENAPSIPRIVARTKKTTNGKYEYLIKWKGYELEKSTWEPIENLNCPERMREFQESREVLDVGPIDQGTPRKRDPKSGGGPRKHRSQ